MAPRGRDTKGPLRRSIPALLLLAACGLPETRRNVPYDDRFGSATTLDLYLPADDREARPAVMFVHGGAWVVGEKEDFAQQAARLAASGWETASINYRLAPKDPLPTPVHDSFCALSFLRAHAGEFRLDPHRVAVLGYSAGGHLVSMLGTAEE